ncbi:KH domain-containing protein [Trichinella spiralis]|uniref:KH domain-containing protein n=1 Tax=Trichinella spiralis TaxID=6334 RepID=A0ABR3KB89_TRISP
MGYAESWHSVDCQFSSSCKNDEQKQKNAVADVFIVAQGKRSLVYELFSCRAVVFKVVKMFSRERFQQLLRRSEELIDVLSGYRNPALRSVAMERLISEEFLPELFKRIPQPPIPWGYFIRRQARMTIMTNVYPFNVASRIIGPAGSTIRAMSRYSGCRLGVVDWRIGKAIEAIQYVVKDENCEVSLNQLAEQAVRRGCRTFPRMMPQPNRRNFAGANECRIVVENENTDEETEYTAKSFDSSDGDEPE